MNDKGYLKYVMLCVFLLNAFCVITLLPSGILHYYLGPFVYLRDALLLVVLCVDFAVFLLFRFFLCESGMVVLFFSSFILLSIGVASLFSGMDSSVLICFKWVAIWFVFYVFGRVFAFDFISSKTVRKWFVVLAFSYFVMEAFVGIYERHTMAFFIDFSGMQETVAGVGVSKDQQLAESWFLRVRGFQRNVFVYSNNMLIGSMLSAGLLVLSKRTPLKLMALMFCMLFLYAVYISGGRSGLIGTAGFYLALLFCIMVKPLPVKEPLLLVFLCLICVVVMFLSFFGISGIVEFVSSLFFSNTNIGNVNSTYDRESYWAMLLNDLYESGGLLWGCVMQMLYHGERVSLTYLDNQYIWFLYHLGVLGVGGYLVFLLSLIRFASSRLHCWEVCLFVGSLSAVVTEGVARESLFFLGTGVMLFFLGRTSSATIEMPKVI